MLEGLMFGIGRELSKLVFGLMLIVGIAAVVMVIVAIGVLIDNMKAMFKRGKQ